MKALKTNIAEKNDTTEMISFMEKLVDGQKKRKDNLAKASSLSDKDKYRFRRIIEFFSNSIKILVEKGNENKDVNDAFAVVKAGFDDEVAEMKESVSNVKARLHNLFEYVGKAFEEGNEMLLLVTELTVNENSSRFIAQFGSEDYTRASETLMISERQDAIKQEILELEI